MPDILKKLIYSTMSRCSNPKTGKVFTVCCGRASQSIGRGQISREGALDVRESRERRDKIFAEKTENAKTFGSETAVFDGNFSFFWPRKNQLWVAGGGYNFQTG